VVNFVSAQTFLFCVMLFYYFSLSTLWSSINIFSAPWSFKNIVSEQTKQNLMDS